MEPFYFGGDPPSLFGVFHPPRGRVTHRIAALICPAVGQEAIRSHRALFGLAQRFSEAGIPCLRFDYYGCGDSFGELAAATIDRWLVDIRVALAELRHGVEVEGVGLVGLRLGAALATLATLESETIDRLVLWDTVVDGGQHLRELRSHHDDWLRGSFASARPSSTPGAELLGFEFSPELIAGIAGIDLPGIWSRPAGRILVIDTTEPGSRGLVERLRGLGASVVEEVQAGACVWRKSGGDLDGVLVPPEVLSEIVEWWLSTET